MRLKCDICSEEAQYTGKYILCGQHYRDMRKYEKALQIVQELAPVARKVYAHKR